jgi:hypothetical protein
MNTSVQYYTFKLSDEAQKPCVIITPIGLFQYNAATMGIKQSPDFAQEVIEDILHDLDDVKVYIDNIGLWLHNDANSEKLETKVPTQSQDHCLAADPLKCE